MDFKKIYAGGEPRISNPDLMFTQYSNYYALQGLASGLDSGNKGVIIDGCEVSATFNSIDEVVTINLSDGYIGVEGQMVKVQDTPALVDVDVNFTNPSVVVYVYATPNVTFNPLGDKTFNDNVARQTWEETRVVLSTNQTGGDLAGAIKIGYIGITRNSTITTFTKIAQNIDKTIIEANNSTAITTTNRNAKTTSIVTPDVLYDVMGNWSMQVLTSISSTVINDTKQYVFNLPSDTVGVFLIGAQTFISGTDLYIGNAGTPDLSYQTYAFDYSLKTLQVYFSQVGVTLSGTAQCMVMVNRISQY